jgi:hypothetical protein
MRADCGSIHSDGHGLYSWQNIEKAEKSRQTIADGKGIII